MFSTMSVLSFTAGEFTHSSTSWFERIQTPLKLCSKVFKCRSQAFIEPIHSDIRSQPLVFVKLCSSVHDIYPCNHVQTWATVALLIFFHCTCSFGTEVQSFIRLLQRLIRITLLDCRHRRKDVLGPARVMCTLLSSEHAAKEWKLKWVLYIRINVK